MTTLRLFASEHDIIEDRRRARIERAQRQHRCPCCGRFTKPRNMCCEGTFCAVCGMDYRPAIRRKVEQAKLWWASTHEFA